MIPHRIWKPALVALLGVLITAQTSFAEIRVDTVPLTDQHLYMRQNSQEVSYSSFAFGTVGGGGRSASYTAANISFYRGAVPISDDRFLELLEISGAAPNFVEDVRSRQGLGMLGIIGGWVVSPLLAGLGPVVMFQPGQYFAGIGMVTIGGLGLIIGSIVAATHLGRQFSLDAAADAIQAYNAKLDGVQTPVKTPPAPARKPAPELAPVQPIRTK